MLGPSGHRDTFTRDNLPPFSEWPELLLEGFDYPEYLNAGYELCDRMVKRGFGDNIALIGDGRRRTYRELMEWTNRVANVLVEDFDLKPGNRILIRSANTPAMVACWLAATKAGAVVVNSMPMLRAAELSKMVNKAEIEFALCDARLLEDMLVCANESRYLKHVIGFDGTAGHNADLDRRALSKSADFTCVKTGRDDVALLGFTSGTTGVPKATMHFHRDLLIIADAYAKEVIAPTPNDVFIGSPPLAFTFGLGGLAAFPLRYGAASVLIENAQPQVMFDLIEEHGATICFTAATAYKVMLKQATRETAPKTLRLAISAGETLPGPVFEEWTAKTGVPILDGIGSTEMLHIFISNRLADRAPATTGTQVGGYQAMIVDADIQEVPRGTIGSLAVKGPIGCRYLADARQNEYVRSGWNITGDSFFQDEQGYFHFAARADDMIVSSGYNIAGPEVESALLSHPSVFECAVTGADDADRGQIVEAHVVLVEGVAADGDLVKALQDHVKSAIAPYKYPRSIRFVDALPKTESGKVQRFRLKTASPVTLGA